MIDEIKLLLGASAERYSDVLIGLCVKHALMEIQTYCNRNIDDELELIAQQIAIIKLNRMNTEGLANQAYSGVSESYIDGYPAEIIAVLNRKRKLKVI